MNKHVLMAALSMLVACAACNPGTNPDGTPTGTGNSGGTGSTGGGTGGSSTGGSTGGAGPYTGPGWAFLGRVSPGDSDPKAEQTLSWPASGVVSSFTGTSSVTVKVSSQDGAAFVIVVDDKTPIPVTQTSQQVTNLDPKATHTLKLIKRNESQYGDGTFNGITLGTGGSFVAPPSLARRIEVIGDSISAGYGVLGTGGPTSCKGSASNEDSTQAYGPIAAAALSADLHLIAWSGQGLFRNNGGSTTTTMPMIWEREVESDSSSVYDFSWVPQAVVINLGTNDFATGIPDADTFEGAYGAFISDIRAKYGDDTHIYCAVGPMLDQTQRPKADEYVKAVVSASGDTKVHYLSFPTQDPTTSACDYHPNMATQRSMALEQLVPALKKDLKW